jgi:hypothetical protein
MFSFLEGADGVVVKDVAQQPYKAAQRTELKGALRGNL